PGHVKARRRSPFRPEELDQIPEMPVGHLLVTRRAVRQDQAAVGIEAEARLRSREPGIWKEKSAIRVVVPLHMIKVKRDSLQLGVEAMKMPLQNQKRLVGAVALDAKVHDLKREAGLGGQAAGERLLVPHSVSEGVGAAHEYRRRRLRIASHP